MLKRRMQENEQQHLYELDAYVSASGHQWECPFYLFVCLFVENFIRVYSEI